MRLPNLEGYLKFPGPFPVASIRLKYVARPAAAERFVPRRDDGAGADGDAEGVASAVGAASAASAGTDGIAVPEPPERQRP